MEIGAADEVSVVRVTDEKATVALFGIIIGEYAEDAIEAATVTLLWMMNS